MKTIKSSEYLSSKKSALSKLEEEIKLLESFDLPLTIKKYEDKIHFFSEDYSLATNVKIKKRSDIIDHGQSTPEGGYYTQRHEYYPQFYFRMRRGQEDIKVVIEHEGFDDDENVVLKSYDVTTGTKEFSDHSGTTSNYVDPKKAISYFSDKGVKKELLEKLEKKLKKLNEWVI